MASAAQWARRAALGVLAIVVVAYGAAVAYLKLNETGLIFHPLDDSAEGGRLNDPTAALQVDTVRFDAADGTHLAAWVMPPEHRDSTSMWVLICHGNAGNITLTKRQDFYAHLRALGVGILAFDYRGYGASQDRAPNEAGVYLDAKAAYAYLHTVRGIPANRIVIFGHSLGSGIAVELASHDSAAGLVVEGAYTSVPDVGQRYYPYLPVKLIAASRFASIDKIGHIATPKLLLHATDDGVIPFDLGQRLFAQAAAPKQFQELTGGHEDSYRLDPRYFQAFAAFVQRVRPRGCAPSATSNSSVGGCGGLVR